MSLQTDSLIRHSRLQVASDLEEMATVIEWFDQFYYTHLPYQMWIEAQTGLIEGFTNAVRHAHQHLDPQTPIDLAVAVFTQSLQICIWDQGDIFDLETALENLQKQTSDRYFQPLEREAHWGCIFLLRLRQDYHWAVSYIREAEGKNCLLLKKKMINHSS